MSANSIEDIAVREYKNNLDYFQKDHPKLYEKLYLLDLAIEQGSYESRYDLEYKDSYFDIKDIKSGQFLYGEDSLEFATKVKEHITNNKLKSVVEGYYHQNYTDLHVELSQGLLPEDSFDTTVAPVVKYIESITKEKEYIKDIKKFMFFGVGLATHIESIYKKLDQNAICFIVEDDLELFRLSLFTISYSQIGQSATLHFSIMDDKTEFRDKFDTFFNDGFMLNHYLKYFVFDDSYHIKMQDIQTFIVNQSHMGYPHEKVLKKYIEAIEPIKKEYNFLNISQHFSDTVFEKKPVLLLLAGPSLDKNMQWLVDNHDKFIIICAFMILPILEKKGITPDIVIHIDEQKQHIRDVLSKVNLFEYATKSLFIFSPSIPLDLFDVFNLKDRIYLIEDRSHYKKDYGYLQGTSIGETGYALALIFNTKKLYLLGFDLAHDSQTGKSHADGHITDAMLDIDSSSKDENISLRETLVKVKGNFRDIVYTTPLFEDSIFMANKFSKMYKGKTQKIYNLNDGAYFDNTIPTKINDVYMDECIDKIDLAKSLENEFLKYSSSSLTEQEVDLFRDRLHECQYKRMIIKNFEKTKFITLEKFYLGFVELADILISFKDKDTSQLSQVYNVYFHIIGGYITDLYNTQGINNHKKIIKELKKILALQCDRLAKSYQQSLESIV